MSIYQQLMKAGSQFLGDHQLFKYGFNFSPMYRRSTARITEVSKDLLVVKIKLPISYRNRNYVNSIFGGSMFAAVDPIQMIQLIQLLGEEYVVWDKSAEIYFKRPAREDLFAEFEFTAAELEHIQSTVRQEQEMTLTKVVQLTNKDKSVVFCEVKKVIYVATKAYYQEKRKKKQGG